MNKNQELQSLNDLKFKLKYFFLGNILVIIAIKKYSYLQITNNIFLASLAIADLAVAITAMTLNAAQLLSGEWFFGAFMCRLWFACDVLFSTSSILHLFMVSVDRYLSISDEYSFYYKAEDPTKSWRIRIMISSVWIVSLLLSTLPIFSDFFTTSEHSILIDNLDIKSGQCAFVVNRPYRLISSCVSFWIPATGVIIFYSLVMKKANLMEINKLNIYKSVALSNNNLESNNNEKITNKNRSSKDTTRGSTGEVVWKRKYKGRSIQLSKNHKHIFKRRIIIENCFSWIYQNQRTYKRFDKSNQAYMSFLFMAFIRIILRRI